MKTANLEDAFVNYDNGAWVNVTGIFRMAKEGRSLEYIQQFNTNEADLAGDVKRIEDIDLKHYKADRVTFVGFIGK